MSVPNPSMIEQDPLQRALEGALLGGAVGDALGLPAEGLSRGRIERLGWRDWRHRFVFGRGMCSDDTEHAFFVAQALLAGAADPEAFQRRLAWKLRFWILGVPAGIGLATLRAVLRLWAGVPPGRAGVFSAGNGPAMRTALIGVYFAEDPAARRAFVQASTRLTHSDPRALTAAWAVAEAAAAASIGRAGDTGFIRELRALGDDSEWPTICDTLEASLQRKESVEAFARGLGLGNGVSGYAYHTVPVALYAWMRHPGDFRAALEGVLNCGGDTDTAGAIAGGVAGAAAGAEGIPAQWLSGVVEWPRTLEVMREAAARLAAPKRAGRPAGPVGYFWPGVAVRNAFFLAAVLFHGLRRLGPPR